MIKTIYKVNQYRETKEEEEDIIINVLAGAHYMDLVGGMVSVSISSERNNLKAVSVNTEEMVRNGFSIPWASSVSYPVRYNGKAWVLPWVLIIDDKHPWVWEREGKTHIDVYIDIEGILSVFKNE